MSKKPKLVQAEPHLIDPDLPGQKLASPLRRGFALGFDLFIGFFVCLPFYLCFVFLILQIQAPGLTSKVQLMFSEEPPPGIFGLISEELGWLFYERKPYLIPEEMLEAFKANDRERVSALFDNYSFDLKLDESVSYFDQGNRRIRVGRDVVFGKLASAVSIAGFVFMYFTLFMRLGRGKSPGKWLMRIRVVRIDGKPLTLMNCFGRATGYTSSLSSLGLGFLQVFWTPNQQTTHDTIANTVVIRTSKKPREKRPPVRR